MTRADSNVHPYEVEKHYYGLGKEEIRVPGITLREHFAAMAMQGLLAAPQEVTGRSHDEVRASYARQAVAYADALLAALAKERP